MENTQFNDHDIEQFREKLSEQHRTQFLEKLRNEDDPANERFQLIEVVGQAVERLKDLEEKFLKEQLSDDSDTVCPGCLAKNVVDLNNIRTIAVLYNQYISEGCDAHLHE